MKKRPGINAWESDRTASASLATSRGCIVNNRAPRDVDCERLRTVVETTRNRFSSHETGSTKGRKGGGGRASPQLQGILCSASD